MAIEAFVTKSLAELKVIICAIDAARQGGPLEELRISGVLTRTAAPKKPDLDLMYDQARYQAYKRVKCNPNASADDKSQYVNPYPQRTMSVETINRHAGGWR